MIERSLDSKAKLAHLVSFTTLTVAVASITLAIEGNLKAAGVLILVGYLLDGVDGEIARRLRGASDFGTQLDSLVDIVHFGVATSVLIGQHVRSGPIGGLPIWVFLSLYMVCASFRLARFNLASGSHSKQVTTGLTISTAGAYLTLAVLADAGMGEQSVADWAFLPVLVIVSLLMASWIPFPDLKGLLRYRAPLVATFVAGALASLWLPFETSLLGVWTVYVLFGTLRAGVRIFV